MIFRESRSHGLDDNSNGETTCPTSKDLAPCHQNSQSTFFHRSSNWSANEEMELLNGIENFGYGNWEAIAKLLKPHTPEEVCKEYIERYVDGVMGRLWTEGTEGCFQVKDESSGMSKEELNVVNMPSQSQLEQLGCKPFRDDFDVEYENDAEKILTWFNWHMPIGDELDVALKLANIDIYNSYLKERERRKRMVFDYALIAKFFKYRRERYRNSRRPSGEKEVFQKLRWLCRFQSSSQYNCLVKNIQRHRDLRSRLKVLTNYRQNGVTKIEELPHFEQESRLMRKRFDNFIDGGSNNNLLSPAELKLCKDLRLSAPSYTNIKATLLMILREQRRVASAGDNRIVQRVSKFMELNGWL